LGVGVWGVGPGPPTPNPQPPIPNPQSPIPNRLFKIFDDNIRKKNIIYF